MARIKTTRAGMLSYLIVFGFLMLFSEYTAIGVLCLVIGIGGVVLLIKFPDSRNF